MIPIGYMAKHVMKKRDWVENDLVEDIYSVSSCMSEDFTDYINFWKHNGYWFFDSPEIISALAKEHNINLAGTKLFYYEVYEYQYDEIRSTWEPFEPEPSMVTDVQIPKEKTLEGCDVVSFYISPAPGCSYLSCNNMAAKIKVNRHCLIPSFEEAKSLLSQGAFDNCEPGPSRIFVVYSVSDV